MNMRTFLLLLFLFVGSAYAHDPSVSNAGPVLNKDGSVVTGILTAEFDPGNGVLPFPSNLFFTGTTDLTININFDPADPSAPLFQTLNALDGFSTTEKWTASFIDETGAPGSIDPSSVMPGVSVRVFQVMTAQFVAVTGLVKELVAGVDFTAAASGSVVAIIPLKPLDENASYMAVLTNDIRDTDGNNATPSRFYHLSKAHTPWIDAQGNSTYALLNNVSAQGAEQLRQITATMEAAAGAAGIPHEDIILAWTVKTQSISTSLRLLRQVAQPAPVTAFPTGFDTSAAGSPFGIADIHAGIISLPYYLAIPTPQNPFAVITDPWMAEPGGYLPPFDQLGLDPTSTNVTAINPFPQLTGIQTVPMIITVPNAKSGFTKPEGGWPVVIYQHGVTRNRTDVLALADSLASVGLATISIDQPLHGVVPTDEPELAPFYIENHPVFGDLAQERHFDLDLFNNTTGAPGPDGVPDASGDAAVAALLLNPLAARDGLRQSIADLGVLAASIGNISIDGDATPDLDPGNVSALFHSLGTTVGMPFLAIEPTVSRAYIGAATGALVRTAFAGDFGGALKGALAAAGILEGTPEYETVLTVIQTAVDSGDGVNYATEAATNMPIIHNQVIGDRTVPNGVPGAPLAGNEAINRLMGLQQYSSTQVNLDGIRGVAKFLPPAFHESLFRPVSIYPPFEVAPEVTIEMQTQAASFLVSGGTLVQVNNPDVLEQVMNLNLSGPNRIINNPGTGLKKKRSGSPANGPSRATSAREIIRGGHEQ